MPEAPQCVYCRRRPATQDWLPFCSDRCKMADLGRWLSGDYRVPGAGAEEGADDLPPDADPDDSTL